MDSGKEQKPGRRSLLQRLRNIFRRKPKVNHERRLNEVSEQMLRYTPEESAEIKPQKKPPRAISSIVREVIKDESAAKASKRRTKKTKSARKRKLKKRVSLESVSALKSWRSRKKQEVSELKQKLKDAETPTLKAEGGIQIVYGSGTTGQEIEDPETEIENTKKLMKKLEIDYLKRRIPVDQYREQMYSYREKMRLLELKIKRGQEQVKENSLASSKQQVSTAPKVPTFQETQKRGEIKIPSNIPVQKSTYISSVIRNKAAGKIDENRIAEMESQVNNLLQKHRVSQHEVVEGIRNLDTNKLINSFDRLISLLEMEHEAKQDAKNAQEAKNSQDAMQSKAEVHETTHTDIAPPKRQKEEVPKGVEKEIVQKQLITDFDRILDFVKKQGSTTSGKISSELKITKKQVLSCCELLEKDDLLVLNYPPIGDIKVRDADYIPPKKNKKSKGDKK